METKTLFGKDKSGGYKVWSIHTNGPCLVISYGKEGGKITTKEELVKGKNIGRANETSPEEQAELEAMSRYRKQVDKGYRENKEDLEELPLLPMLAADYLKVGHRIQWPCYTSVKLDGVRCLAIREKSSVRLVSRGGKEYKLPHIQNNLLKVMEEGEVWDGEVYIHGYELEDIVSATKKPNELTPKLQFWVFDVVEDLPFSKRLLKVNEIGFRLLADQNRGVLDTLLYSYCKNETEMKNKHKSAVEKGFEGIMLRNNTGLYESGKRSGDLQKYKEFMDAEFKILSVEEDKNGNAVFLLFDNTAKKEFHCTYGNFEQRKEFLESPEKYIGKWLTVKFQKRYKDSLLPQFPTGVGFRDCDEKGEPLV